MLSFYFSLLLMVIFLLGVFVFYCVYRYVSTIRSDRSLSAELARRNVLGDPTRTSDALRMFIIDYLDDNYSPMGGVSLSDHLYSDVGIDSLDMATVLSDVGHVTYTRPSVSEFVDLYGRNPSVSDLIRYIRSLMVKAQNNI